MSWSDGYNADTEYTSHFFAELAPPLLDLAALTAGVMPPEREGGRFRYCELGCGNGMSTAILAASHPNAEFVGIDFMPVHVANARRAAKRGGLKNARFLELSFADACREDLGSFDYIVAHGLLSWVPPQGRAELLHDIELALGAVQVAGELGVRYALQVAEGLVEGDAQPEVGGDVA